MAAPKDIIFGRLNAELHHRAPAVAQSVVERAPTEALAPPVLNPRDLVAAVEENVVVPPVASAATAAAAEAQEKANSLVENNYTAASAAVKEDPVLTTSAAFVPARPTIEAEGEAAGADDVVEEEVVEEVDSAVPVVVPELPTRVTTDAAAEVAASTGNTTVTTPANPHTVPAVSLTGTTTMATSTTKNPSGSSPGAGAAPQASIPKKKPTPASRAKDTSQASADPEAVPILITFVDVHHFETERYFFAEISNAAFQRRVIGRSQTLSVDVTFETELTIRVYESREQAYSDPSLVKAVGKLRIPMAKVAKMRGLYRQWFNLDLPDAPFGSSANLAFEKNYLHVAEEVFVPKICLSITPGAGVGKGRPGDGLPDVAAVLASQRQLEAYVDTLHNELMYHKKQNPYSLPQKDSLNMQEKMRLHNFYEKEGPVSAFQSINGNTVEAQRLMDQGLNAPKSLLIGPKSPPVISIDKYKNLNNLKQSGVYDPKVAPLYEAKDKGGTLGKIVQSPEYGYAHLDDPFIDEHPGGAEVKPGVPDLYAAKDSRPMTDPHRKSSKGQFFTESTSQALDLRAEKQKVEKKDVWEKMSANALAAPTGVKTDTKILPVGLPGQLEALSEEQQLREEIEHRLRMEKEEKLWQEKKKQQQQAKEGGAKGAGPSFYDTATKGKKPGVDVKKDEVRINAISMNKEEESNYLEEIDALKNAPGNKKKLFVTLEDGTQVELAHVVSSKSSKGTSSARYTSLVTAPAFELDPKVAADERIKRRESLSRGKRMSDQVNEPLTLNQAIELGPLSELAGHSASIGLSPVPDLPAVDMGPLTKVQSEKFTAVQPNLQMLSHQLQQQLAKFPPQGLKLEQPPMPLLKTNLDGELKFAQFPPRTAGLAYRGSVSSVAGGAAGSSEKQQLLDMTPVYRAMQDDPNSVFKVPENVVLPKETEREINQSALVGAQLVGNSTEDSIMTKPEQALSNQRNAGAADVVSDKNNKNTVNKMAKDLQNANNTGAMSSGNLGSGRGDQKNQPVAMFFPESSRSERDSSEEEFLKQNVSFLDMEVHLDRSSSIAGGATEQEQSGILDQHTETTARAAASLVLSDEKQTAGVQAGTTANKKKKTRSRSSSISGKRNYAEQNTTFLFSTTEAGPAGDIEGFRNDTGAAPAVPAASSPDFVWPLSIRSASSTASRTFAKRRGWSSSTSNSNVFGATTSIEPKLLGSKKTSNSVAKKSRASGAAASSSKRSSKGAGAAVASSLQENIKSTLEQLAGITTTTNTYLFVAEGEQAPEDIPPPADAAAPPPPTAVSAKPGPPSSVASSGGSRSFAKKRGFQPKPRGEAEGENAGNMIEVTSNASGLAGQLDAEVNQAAKVRGISDTESFATPADKNLRQMTNKGEYVSAGAPKKINEENSSGPGESGSEEESDDVGLSSDDQSRSEPGKPRLPPGATAMQMNAAIPAAADKAQPFESYAHIGAVHTAMNDVMQHLAVRHTRIHKELQGLDKHAHLHHRQPLHSRQHGSRKNRHFAHKIDFVNANPIDLVNYGNAPMPSDVELSDSGDSTFEHVPFTSPDVMRLIEKHSMKIRPKNLENTRYNNWGGQEPIDTSLSPEGSLEPGKNFRRKVDWRDTHGNKDHVKKHQENPVPKYSTIPGHEVYDHRKRQSKTNVMNHLRNQVLDSVEKGHLFQPPEQLHQETETSMPPLPPEENPQLFYGRERTTAPQELRSSAKPKEKLDLLKDYFSYRLKLDRAVKKAGVVAKLNPRAKEPTAGTAASHMLWSRIRDNLGRTKLQLNMQAKVTGQDVTQNLKHCEDVVNDALEHVHEKNEHLAQNKHNAHMAWSKLRGAFSVKSFMAKTMRSSVETPTDELLKDLCADMMHAVGEESNRVADPIVFDALHDLELVKEAVREIVADDLYEGEGDVIRKQFEQQGLSLHTHENEHSERKTEEDRSNEQPGPADFQLPATTSQIANNLLSQPRHYVDVRQPTGGAGSDEFQHAAMKTQLLLEQLQNATTTQNVQGGSIAPLGYPTTGAGGGSTAPSAVGPPQSIVGPQQSTAASGSAMAGVANATVAGAFNFGMSMQGMRVLQEEQQSSALSTSGFSPQFVPGIGTSLAAPLQTAGSVLNQQNNNSPSTRQTTMNTTLAMQSASPEWNRAKTLANMIAEEIDEDIASNGTVDSNKVNGKIRRAQAETLANLFHSQANLLLGNNVQLTDEEAISLKDKAVGLSRQLAMVANAGDQKKLEESRAEAKKITESLIKEIQNLQRKAIYM
ncbi:unnamed protein product [Amoebophrya sp. A120]|nr:unnamed protein product [Amoebophrya sp. A120]|eukprot:GSA120T00016483001.1